MGFFNLAIKSTLFFIEPIIKTILMKIKALFILGGGENMGSRKGIPNKITRYDTDIIPRLADIKEWLMCKRTIQPAYIY